MVIYSSTPAGLVSSPKQLKLNYQDLSRFECDAMGNAEVRDMAPARDEVRKELDLSRRISHKQYIKHINGEFSEACLLELPWEIRDAVSLYECMDISFNRIMEIPPELPLRVPHLRHVNLCHNQLDKIPESIGLLFHLETILVSNNLLQSLPSSITRLERLEKLDVSHNHIRELPVELGCMKSLCRLNVSHNKLKSLPTSLGIAKKLSVVLARNNRFHSPLRSVVDEGSDALIQHMRKQASIHLPSDSPVSTANMFNRVRGNQLQFSVPNLQSAMVEYMQTQTNTTNTPSRIKTPLMPPLDASNLDVNELRNRILGLIFGAAIGDAVGIATDNMKPDECHFHYDFRKFTYSHIIRDSLRTRWKAGDWTIHFDQTALLLDSLVAWAGVVDELDFASRLQDWSLRGFQELGDSDGFVVSNTISKVLVAAGFTSDPHGTAAYLHAHCPAEEPDAFADHGSLARSFIMGVPFFFNLTEVENNAVRICKATHADQRCVAASVTLASITALMLQGSQDIHEPSGIEELLNMAKCHGLKHLQNDEHIKDFELAMACKCFTEANVSENGKHNYVFKPLACSVAALRSSSSYRESISELALMGAASSCNCCITGALLGCRLGYADLPKQWLDDLRPNQHQWLNVKVNLLLDMMAIP